MKYERLTKKDNNGNCHLWDDTVMGTFNAIDGLAELEDKIERGELISTQQEERSEQEVRFFAEHNYGVRKLFADNLKECLRFHLVVGDITKEAYEIVMRVIRYCLDGMKK